MIAYLHKLADFSVLAFVISSMLTMGLSQWLEDVIAPLKKPWPVVLALLVNFVLAPLLSVALTRLVPLQPAHATGLLLLGGAAGAPFLPKLAEISGGSLAYSVALMVLLMVGSIVFMPLVLPLIVPELKAGPLTIAKPLLVLMLLPLAVGFALALTGASWVEFLLIFVRKISNLSLVVFVLLIVGLNLNTLAGTIGSFAIGTYTLFVLGMVGAGYLVSGADKSTQAVFALSAGLRNITAALVLAGSSFDDPAITVMMLVASVVSLVVLLILAKVIRQNTADPDSPYPTM